MLYQTILDDLCSLADPEVARQSQCYFKTGEGEYGFGDKFLGIRVPIVRKAVKRYRDTPVDVAARLLKSEYHEVRLFALLLLVLRFSKGDEAEQKVIFELYLANTQYINNWDLVDSSAHKIVGRYLEHRNRSLLYTLAASELLWERRIAVIATFHFIDKEMFDDALNIAELLLSDKEDLIHKAVGWMLREVGKKNLSQETEFLKLHYKAMPRTMLRYAIEKFSPEIRASYLKGEI